VILAPGTILQRMYLRERLARLAPGRFVEVGAGQAHLSGLLLECGWTGIGYDLADDGLARAPRAVTDAMRTGHYQFRRQDWLDAEPAGGVDLVVSAMVLEHLDEAQELGYFKKAESELAPGGLAILLVPASPAHWGIEDEIAGHHRRYTRAHLEETLRRTGWTLRHAAGLTYPLSNLLLPLSNRLVGQAEGHRTSLSRSDRTRQSGHRDVAFKTRFPRALGLLLNEWTLYPFHLWQKAAHRHPSALVLYAECAPA
jgi:SAM-dependent methyltransferase